MPYNVELCYGYFEGECGIECLVKNKTDKFCESWCLHHV